MEPSKGSGADPSCLGFEEVVEVIVGCGGVCGFGGDGAGARDFRGVVDDVDCSAGAGVFPLEEEETGWEGGAVFWGVSGNSPGKDCLWGSGVSWERVRWMVWILDSRSWETSCSSSRPKLTGLLFP